MRYSNILIVLFSILFYSCVNEVMLPVNANFTVTAIDDNYSVPVKIRINNYTTGADTYKWSFYGSDRDNSESINPGIVVYREPGEYIINLEASNVDGSIDIHTSKVNIYGAISGNFEINYENEFSPVNVNITNNVSGLSYEWYFEGGIPSSSNLKNPPNVTFTKPGLHKIQLTVSNGYTSEVFEKFVNVLPYLKADFSIETDFLDYDYQVPVKINLTNKSVSAEKYEWYLNGKLINIDKDNPSVLIQEVGNQNLKLVASNNNGQNKDSFSVNFQTLANTNIYVFNDVKLGINTAHSNNSRGAFFSSRKRKVFTAAELSSIDGSYIDFVFYGLNNQFKNNYFLSPDAISNYYSVLDNSSKTIVLNNINTCSNCPVITESDFNYITDDTLLSKLIFPSFSDVSNIDLSENLPKIILFQTFDKRVGVIKIKSITNLETNSFITVDIKIQK